MGFADGRQANYDNIQKREYHHIFPEALLSDAGIDGNLALNCALITWKTNRIIGRKDPLEYLQDRVEWANEDEVRERLKSHLISYDQLSMAHYSGLSQDKQKQKIKTDFDNFLSDRGRLVVAAMNALVEGDSPKLEALWALHLNGEANTSGSAL